MTKKFDIVDPVVATGLKLSYILKQIQFNDRNTRTKCKIRSKLTIKTPK